MGIPKSSVTSNQQALICTNKSVVAAVNYHKLESKTTTWLPLTSSHLSSSP